MSDALDLIAEARSRQERAERECDHWKAQAKRERRRCRRVIEMAKLRPLPAPKMYEGGIADFSQLRDVVDVFADVIADPYARYPDDEEGYGGMTHETAKDLMTMRLQHLIESAVKAKQD